VAVFYKNLCKDQAGCGCGASRRTLNIKNLQARNDSVSPIFLNQVESPLFPRVKSQKVLSLRFFLFDGATIESEREDRLYRRGGGKNDRILRI
jgi:hypothetical protein